MKTPECRICKQKSRRIYIAKDRRITTIKDIYIFYCLTHGLIDKDGDPVNIIKKWLYMKKQIDVIGRILKCIEILADEDEITNGEVNFSMYELANHVYNEITPNNSKMRSLYRAVNNLEKKGVIYSKKIKSLDSYWGDKDEWGGLRYEKEIYAKIKNGKLVKKCWIQDS